jgi:putative transposase
MNTTERKPKASIEKKESRRGSSRAERRSVSMMLEEKAVRKEARAYKRLQGYVFNLFSKREISEIAKESGFQKRNEERKIPAFEFVLCCALAATVEGKRGFASVWRLLAAACGIGVARSAVTQRFGSGSAALMKQVFERAVSRLPTAAHPKLLGKLEAFQHVLADDGTVLKLKPLLEKLFPATRTNTMAAAGKLHARADLVNRRIVHVELTGERGSEIAASRRAPISQGTLYIADLGYTSYSYYDELETAGADFLFRLKDNANPKVVDVRHGVFAPKRSIGMKLNDVAFCRTQDTFDVDAEFTTDKGTAIFRVVGCFNPETDKYHCYVTTLPPETYTANELANLYSLRWVIELLFKLLKSSCHLDHLNTESPDALRTHIYASLLAATILSAMAVAAADEAGIPINRISVLTMGIAAGLMAIPLMLLWLERELSYDELALMIMRTIIVGCRDQNVRRSDKKWGHLR